MKYCKLRLNVVSSPPEFEKYIYLTQSLYNGSFCFVVVNVVHAVIFQIWFELFVQYLCHIINTQNKPDHILHYTLHTLLYTTYLAKNSHNQELKGNLKPNMWYK